jgi:hypothetical protein
MGVVMQNKVFVYVGNETLGRSPFAYEHQFTD